MADEFSDNPVIEAVRGLKKGVRFLRAINEPSNQSDYILKYGIMSFNIKTGLFAYGTRKPIQRNEHLKPYKIIYLLFFANGSEVLYEKFAEKLEMPYKTIKDKRETREKIRQVCRQTRRTLGINANKSPQENPFIMSGKGIKLAFIL